MENTPVVRRAWPSRGTLAHIVGVSPRSIWQAITELEKAVNRGPGKTSLFKMRFERNEASTQERKHASTQYPDRAEEAFHAASNLSGSVAHAEWKSDDILNGSLLPPEPSRGTNIEEPERETPSRNSKGRSKQRRSIPPSWPDEKDREGALAFWHEEGRDDLCGRINDIAAKAREHHTANGTRFADWNAAWRNWARREVEFTKPPDEHPLAGGMSAALGVLSAMRRT